MKPILYPASEVEFVNNGLGRLSEATKCLVTEERNGQYELEMVYPNLPKRLYIGGRGDSEKPLKIGIILEKRFTNVCISDII